LATTTLIDKTKYDPIAYGVSDQTYVIIVDTTGEIENTFVITISGSSCKHHNRHHRKPITLYVKRARPPVQELRLRAVEREHAAAPGAAGQAHRGLVGAAADPHVHAPVEGNGYISPVIPTKSIFYV